MNNVIITLRSVQDGDGKNPIAYVTEGVCESRDGRYIITYNESAQTGLEGTKATVTAGDGKVVMRRTGSTEAELTIEQGVTHKGVYSTPYGSFDISTTAGRVDFFAGEGFGEIYADYTVHMDGSPAVENSFYMKFIFTI